MIKGVVVCSVFSLKICKKKRQILMNIYNFVQAIMKLVHLFGLCRKNLNVCRHRFVLI